MRSRRTKPPRAALQLPHEHDESPEAGVDPSPVIAQAAADLDAGRVDTDDYTRAGEASGYARKRRVTRP